MSITRNRITVISLGIIILASLCITGISAYFTSSDSAQNQVSVGNNEIEITEVFDNPDIEVNEITTITKQVVVNNTGINPATVRVRVDMSDKSVEDWTDIDYNTEDWTKDGDYWYYNTVLEPGEGTEPLFNEITCNNPTAEQVANFDVYIYAESRNCDIDSTLAERKGLFN